MFLNIENLDFIQKNTRAKFLQSLHLYTIYQQPFPSLAPVSSLLPAAFPGEELAGGELSLDKERRNLIRQAEALSGMEIKNPEEWRKLEKLGQPLYGFGLLDKYERKSFLIRSLRDEEKDMGDNFQESVGGGISKKLGDWIDEVERARGSGGGHGYCGLRKSGIKWAVAVGNKGEEAKMKQKLKREAVLLSKLQDVPGVVGIKDVWESEVMGVFAVRMEAVKMEKRSISYNPAPPSNQQSIEDEDNKNNKNPNNTDNSSSSSSVDNTNSTRKTLNNPDQVACIFLQDSMTTSVKCSEKGIICRDPSLNNFGLQDGDSRDFYRRFDLGEGLFSGEPDEDDGVERLYSTSVDKGYTPGYCPSFEIAPLQSLDTGKPLYPATHIECYGISETALRLALGHGTTICHLSDDLHTPLSDFFSDPHFDTLEEMEKMFDINIILRCIPALILLPSELKTRLFDSISEDVLAEYEELKKLVLDKCHQTITKEELQAMSERELFEEYFCQIDNYDMQIRSIKLGLYLCCRFKRKLLEGFPHLIKQLMGISMNLVQNNQGETHRIAPKFPSFPPFSSPLWVNVAILYQSTFYPRDGNKANRLSDVLEKLRCFGHLTPGFDVPGLSPLSEFKKIRHIDALEKISSLPTVSLKPASTFEDDDIIETSSLRKYHRLRIQIEPFEEDQMQVDVENPVQEDPVQEDQAQSGDIQNRIVNPGGIQQSNSEELSTSSHSVSTSCRKPGLDVYRDSLLQYGFFEANMDIQDFELEFRYELGAEVASLAARRGKERRGEAVAWSKRQEGEEEEAAELEQRRAWAEEAQVVSREDLLGRREPLVLEDYALGGTYAAQFQGGICNRLYGGPPVLEFQSGDNNVFALEPAAVYKAADEGAGVVHGVKGLADSRGEKVLRGKGSELQWGLGGEYRGCKKFSETMAGVGDTGSWKVGWVVPELPGLEAGEQVQIIAPAVEGDIRMTREDLEWAADEGLILVKAGEGNIGVKILQPEELGDEVESGEPEELGDEVESVNPEELGDEVEDLRICKTLLMENFSVASIISAFDSLQEAYKIPMIEETTTIRKEYSSLAAGGRVIRRGKSQEGEMVKTKGENDEERGKARSRSRSRGVENGKRVVDLREGTKIRQVGERLVAKFCKVVLMVLDGKYGERAGGVRDSLSSVCRKLGKELGRGERLKVKESRKYLLGLVAGK